MAIYWFMLVGLTAVGVPLCKRRGLPDKQRKIPTIIYLGLVFLAFFIIAAIRKTTGYDYNLYAQWYNQIIFSDYEWLMNWSREKGFAVPLKILTVITHEWQPMFALIGLIIALGVVVYIYKNSSLAYISVAAFISLGLYYNSLNFMRQFIAALVVSFALNYIESKQPLRFLVLTLFASCFHFSALLMLPFYFILKIKMNWISLGVYAAITAVSFAVSEPLLELVTEHFYTAYDPLTSHHMTIGISPRYAVIFGILFMLCFLFRKELIIKRRFNSVLINAFWFAMYFEIIGIKHSIVSRFALLFLIAPVLALTPDLIAVITEKIKEKFGKETLSGESKGRIFSALAATAFCVYAVTVNAILLNVNYNGVVPYMTVYNHSRMSGES